MGQMPDQLSPRESEIMRHDAEREDKQMEYGMKMKELDIEVEKLQSRWLALLRLPLFILKIPLILLLGIAYIVHAIRGSEPSDSFYNLLK